MVVPDFFQEFDDLEIPNDEVARQAVDSLRGYVYQIYQTLAAWLTLGKEETLLLEVAEDFAVLARDALTATQVKDTAASGSVTLRTKSVLSAIDTLWNFQQANRGKTIRINYLTTSRIGAEKRLSFPGGQNGLTYWHVAAREGSDVQPLRRALLSLNLSTQVMEFVKAATDDDLRERLLRRITWLCGQPDLGTLDQTIRERLIHLGEHLSFTPSDSERAKDALVWAILRAVVSKTGRTLSRADLLRIFEKSTTVSMPIRAVRQLVEAVSPSGLQPSLDLVSGTSVIIDVGLIHRPPRLIERKELVSKLIPEMGRLGSLWLHGSSGLGKTILARLIATRSRFKWLLVQLRDCSGSEFEFRLYWVTQALQSCEVGGLILDDFPTQYVHRGRTRLSILAEEVHRVNGSLIITSAKPPSPNVGDCLGEDGPLVVKVPYLSQEEVAELITLAGGDTKKWTGVIHTCCGFGHPQLVQARISGLRQRGWPDNELLAGLVGSVQDVDAERESTRERLLSELPDGARELLYRLTLVVGFFDQDMANALGELNPPVERPGEAMDILRGPWIETLTTDRFRVSPLVGDAGSKTLGKTRLLEIHRQLVDDLIMRRPFPADFLGTLLSHAMVSRHEAGLAWLTTAIMRARENDRGMIAEQLVILPLLDTYDNEPLFKKNIHLSAMLRLAQFHVAAWANRTDRLLIVADRLLTETQMLSHKEIAEGLRCLAVSSILSERLLAMSPHKWVPLVEELEGILSSEGTFIKTYDLDLNRITKGLGGLSVPRFLFAVRASSPQNIGELGELFVELDQLEKQRREVLLSSLDGIPHGAQLVIDAAWLAEMRQGVLQGAAAADKYRELSAIAEKWGKREIAVRCECARAIMLDEYADDPAGALAALAEAERKYPYDIHILRARARVYYHCDNHPAALAIMEQIAGALPKGDTIERTFALREAAISAAKTGQFAKAADWFCSAHEAAGAPGSNVQAMAIGLKADCALMTFRSGNTNGAIRLMCDALSEAEKLDPKGSKNHRFCWLILLQATMWMQTQTKTGLFSERDFPTVAGCCSNPDPPDKVMDMAYPPLLVAWYQLAILELMCGEDTGVLVELSKRTRDHKILSCELSLNYHLMGKYIAAIDIAAFSSYLPEYVAKMVYMRGDAASISKDNVCELTNADLSPIKPVDWMSNLHLECAKDVILALAASAVCFGIKDFRETLLNHLGQNKEASLSLRPFLDEFEALRQQRNAPQTTASCLGQLVQTNTHMGPNEAFIMTYRIWEWLSGSTFRRILEDRIADYLIRCWRRIIEEQRFNLQRPMIAVPAIKSVMDGSARGAVKLAQLLLAAETAVRYKLGANLRSRLQGAT